MGEDECRHRLVVLGSGAVGKTSIISRFLLNTFPETYKATVEDLHCRNYDINGSLIKVDVLDTAGNLAFPAMRRLSISTAHGFLIVYSVDDRGSFDEVRSLWEQIKEQRGNYQDMPCVIVGNKADLGDDVRAVEREHAQEWARAEGMESALFEISAKNDRGILDIFRKLLEQSNIPAVRKLEPILTRRLSAKDHRLNPQRRLLKEHEEGKLSRSRSLIRRSTKPKVKQSGDPSRNDCVLS